MKVADLRAFDRLADEVDIARKVLGDKASPLLFRGQNDSAFGLQSTLERRLKKPITFLDYFRIINRMKSFIETLTDRKWDLPPFDSMSNLLKEFDDLTGRLNREALPLYGYMVYLRHHGFPSPLLDWSLSPYVAAYFAYRDALFEDPNKKISIYFYCEMPTGQKAWGSREPGIFQLGKYVTSHPRHFRQQSQYTMALNWDASPETKEDQWLFSTHEKAAAIENDVTHQDQLWKFNLPASESPEVLKYLDSFNLNEYSLFGTEESLLQLMAFRELV